MKETILTLVQMNSVTGDPKANLERIADAVSKNSGSDIICFPEMCLSGYTTLGAERFALEPESRCVQAVRELSESSGAAIVFGYMERNGVRPFMRQEIADGKNTMFYRKTHLGSAESEVFATGDELPVFDVKGIRVGIQLCIESHIADICSAYRGKGAELVLTPFSNGVSGERRKQIWMSYMPARACDNGMYVAACGAVGPNGQGAVFGGGLLALDPKGTVMDEYYGIDEHSMTVRIGGKLPRDGPESMRNISYFDRRRPELY